MNKQDQHLILLASYPKSGNTWMRTFLNVLQSEEKVLNNFSELQSDLGILSARVLLDTNLGIKTSDLSELEVQKLRLKAYQFGAKSLNKNVFVKSHDTPFYLEIPIFPKSIVKHVILIVRKPFDMVASYANQMAISIEAAVYRLNSGNNQLAYGKKKLNSKAA